MSTSWAKVEPKCFLLPSVFLTGNISTNKNKPNPSQSSSCFPFAPHKLFNQPQMKIRLKIIWGQWAQFSVWHNFRLSHNGTVYECFLMFAVQLSVHLAMSLGNNLVYNIKKYKGQGSQKGFYFVTKQMFMTDNECFHSCTQ